MHDSLHIKYKNCQDVHIVLAVRIVVSLSDGIGSDWK